MTGMDIAEFLAARYGEEQEAAEDFRSRDWVATGATVRSGPCVQTAGPALYSTRMMGEPWPDEICVPLPTEERPDDFWTLVNLHGTTGKFESETRHAEYIAYWDPARVLADIAAKRSVVEDYRVVMASNALEPDDLRRAASDVVVKTLRMVLRRFAAAYEQHPDFDPAWRIDG